MPDDPPSHHTGFWSRLFGGQGGEPNDRKSIAELLGHCRERGVLESDEVTMLQGVLEVAETKVRDIMVPRSHMVVVEQDDDPKALLTTILESGHSRFPVIGDDRDEVVGVLLAKDLLRFFAEKEGQSLNISNLLRSPVFIPESKRLDALLREFRESRNHMAIVVDEYGGVAGLATIEDVLEQIVGDIDDEHDSEQDDFIQQLDSGVFLVRALTRIEDFNEHFDVQLDDQDYDTVGGLVIHELGRLPRRGERLEVYGFRFKIQRADRRRVETVEVSRIESNDQS